MSSTNVYALYGEIGDYQILVSKLSSNLLIEEFIAECGGNLHLVEDVFAICNNERDSDIENYVYRLIREASKENNKW